MMMMGTCLLEGILTVHGGGEEDGTGGWVKAGQVGGSRRDRWVGQGGTSHAATARDLGRRDSGANGMSVVGGGGQGFPVTERA
jgi:hypothetical protein